MDKQQQKQAEKPAKPVKPLSIAGELKETALDKVSGGAVDRFAMLGDIKGESMDDKHKGEISI
ncbi:MAG TPA: hypothetical protein VGM59_04550 [Dongiaceae bacterium]|jgi:hypothetical protein